MCFCFWRFFETAYATSNNSFSKTTKWNLMFFLCKTKKRSCLFCFFSLVFTFVELKTTKTSNAVKHFSVSSSFLWKNKFSIPHRRSELMIFDGPYASENIEICIIGHTFFFVAKPTTISLSSVNMKSNGPKEKYCTALEVFIVFNSTKVNTREKKQNKQDLFFVLHQKTSKSI